MKHFLLTLLVSAFVLPTFAQDADVDNAVAPATNESFVEQQSAHIYTRQEADSLYAAGEYVSAVDAYEHLLSDSESAALYYNLGNAYFKSDDIARSVLNYERALLLDPTNRDIQFNLTLARSRTVDRVTPKNEIFFVRWFHNFAGQLPVDTWAVIGIALFILTLVLLAVYVFSKKQGLRKFAFIIAIIMLLCTVMINGIASSRKKQLTHRMDAIVMAPSVVVRSTPGPNGIELFVLHEGRKVTITDDTMQAWREIELEDGNVGWMEAEDLERI